MSIEIEKKDQKPEDLEDGEISEGEIIIHEQNLQKNKSISSEENPKKLKDKLKKLSDSEDDSQIKVKYVHMYENEVNLLTSEEREKEKDRKKKKKKQKKQEKEGYKFRNNQNNDEHFKGKNNFKKLKRSRSRTISRSRTRSRSQDRQNYKKKVFIENLIKDKFGKVVCRDLSSGKCNNGYKCYYSHDTQNYPCKNFMVFDTCQVPNCIYSHRHQQNSLYQLQFIEDNEQYLTILLENRKFTSLGTTLIDFLDNKYPGKRYKENYQYRAQSMIQNQQTNFPPPPGIRHQPPPPPISNNNIPYNRSYSSQPQQQQYPQQVHHNQQQFGHMPPNLLPPPLIDSRIPNFGNQNMFKQSPPPPQIITNNNQSPPSQFANFQLNNQNLKNNVFNNTTPVSQQIGQGYQNNGNHIPSFNQFSGSINQQYQQQQQQQQQGRIPNIPPSNFNQYNGHENRQNNGYSNQISMAQLQKQGVQVKPNNDIQQKQGINLDQKPNNQIMTNSSYQNQTPYNNNFNQQTPNFNNHNDQRNPSNSFNAMNRTKIEDIRDSNLKLPPQNSPQHNFQQFPQSPNFCQNIGLPNNQQQNQSQMQENQIQENKLPQNQLSPQISINPQQLFKQESKQQPVQQNSPINEQQPKQSKIKQPAQNQQQQEKQPIQPLQKTSEVAQQQKKQQIQEELKLFDDKQIVIRKMKEIMVLKDDENKWLKFFDDIYKKYNIIAQQKSLLKIYELLHSQPQFENLQKFVDKKLKSEPSPQEADDFLDQKLKQLGIIKGNDKNDLLLLDLKSKCQSKPELKKLLNQVVKGKDPRLAQKQKETDKD